MIPSVTDESAGFLVCLWPDVKTSCVSYQHQGFPWLAPSDYTTAVLILMTLSCPDTGSIQKEDSNLKGMIPWVWQYWDYLGDLAWGTAFLILPCILHAESRMLRSRLIRLILLVLMVVWNPLLRDLTQMWFGTNFHLANQTWVQGDLV